MKNENRPFMELKYLEKPASYMAFAYELYKLLNSDVTVDKPKLIKVCCVMPLRLTGINTSIHSNTTVRYSTNIVSSPCKLCLSNLIQTGYNCGQ